MFKKIILASALAAVSSFAAWDLFPVLEKHNGQVKLGTTYNTYEFMDYDNHSLNIFAAARYTVIQNLELALSMPYRALTYIDGKNIDLDGFGDLHFSARYQFIPTMNVFVDVYAPVWDISDDPWDFDIGLQFSRRVNRLINFGSQLRADFAVRNGYDDIPIDVYGSACLRFAVTPRFTPYFGTSFGLDLGEYSDHGYQYSHGGGDLYLGPYVGALYDFNDFISVDGWVMISKYVNVDEMPDFFFTTGLSVLVNF